MVTWKTINVGTYLLPISTGKLKDANLACTRTRSRDSKINTADCDDAAIAAQRNGLSCPISPLKTIDVASD